MRPNAHVVDALAHELIERGHDPSFAVAAAHVLVALALDDERNEADEVEVDEPEVDVDDVEAHENDE